MRNEYSHISRINLLCNNSYDNGYDLDEELVKNLLIEGIRRSIIWKKILKERARNYYYKHILDDVANCLNPTWSYSSKDDERLSECKVMDRRDRKIIDNYINWEDHSEEIFSQYFHPNPYEPILRLIEIGSGGIVDLEYQIEVRPLLKFSTQELLSEVDLRKQKIIL